MSRIVRLRLACEGAAATAPRSLILKIGLPGHGNDGPHAAGIPPWVWWSHLERITAAIDDLDCRDLLG